MRARSFFLAVLFTPFAFGPSLSGCSDAGSDAEYRSRWTNDRELIRYCSDYCRTLECADARGQGCRDYCEFWLEGLNAKCGDEIRDSLACQAKLSCTEFYDFWDDDPASDENCGDEFTAQVTACGPASAPCEAYCTLGESCDDPKADPFCHDNCRMRQSWFVSYYGEDCLDAAEALLSCEAALTCDEWEPMQKTGETPVECKTERAAFDKTCKH